MDRVLLYQLILASFIIMLLPFIVELIRTMIDRSVSFKDIANQHEENTAIRRLLSRSRLSGMLSLLGIRKDDFIARVPAFDIRKHVAQCKECRDVKTCDRCLKDGICPSDLHFCPNIDSLLFYKKIMPYWT